MKISAVLLSVTAMVSSVESFTSTTPYFLRPVITSRQSTEIRAVAKKTTKKAATKKEEDSVETLRKPEFIASIAEKTGMTKADSEAALAAVLETITEGVASGKKISMLGFGTFKLTHRAARKGRNPKTGEEIDIPASKTPSFSAGKSFKEKCNSA